MSMPAIFTFDEYKSIFQYALKNNYKVITLHDYFTKSFDEEEKLLINRIDVDVKIERLDTIGEIFKELGVVASIYVRLHAPAYNLCQFDNIIRLRKLANIGCEIGLHTELEDLRYFCDVQQITALSSEIQLLETYLDCKIFGTASHGDMTPSNNLDFWKSHSPEDFGLIYEAYDEELWHNCRYISDSEWTQWKAYDNGKLRVDDRRNPKDHIDEGVTRLHLLTHPESWYENYIYEN